MKASELINTLTAMIELAGDVEEVNHELGKYGSVFWLY